jgi:hypothetical protein
VDHSVVPGAARQQDAGQGGHGNHRAHARKRRAKPLGALKAIPWVQAIGGARALWLAMTIVALLMLVFLAAGPVVNINHLSVTF